MHHLNDPSGPKGRPRFYPVAIGGGAETTMSCSHMHFKILGMFGAWEAPKMPRIAAPLLGLFGSSREPIVPAIRLMWRCNAKLLGE